MTYRNPPGKAIDMLIPMVGGQWIDAQSIIQSIDGRPVDHLEAVWRGDRHDFVRNLSRP